uniref:UDP-galactose transporter n=1 Tax=Alexandrium monilatum TaxID=311494 RepID=A0A7S4PWG9_9DINO
MESKFKCPYPPGGLFSQGPDARPCAVGQMSVARPAGRLLESKASTSTWVVVGLVALQILAYTGQSILVTMTKTPLGDYAYDANSAVLLTEAIKMLIALGSLVHAGQHRSLALNVFDGCEDLRRPRRAQGCARQVVLATRLIQRSLVYAIPAFLYVVHNNLIFVALLYLSAPMYQLLNNIKIITTGVVYRLMLNRRLLVIQWVALVQLSIGMACTSLDYGTKGASHSAVASSSAWCRGLAVMIFLAICSSLAGVYTEVLIKTSGLPLQAGNSWLYGYSTLASAMAFFWCRPAERHLLDGFTPSVWAMVLTNSVLGIVISFIFKHGDNIVKLFGASLGVLFTAAVSSHLFGTRTGPGLWVGYALTASSLCLYYGDEQLLCSIDSDVVSRCLPHTSARCVDEEEPKFI